MKARRTLEGKVDELLRLLNLSIQRWNEEHAKLRRISDACAAKDDEIAALREALAPFANRCAEKAMGGKYSALTDRQWRRALETYQECPGGDMCGCKPRNAEPTVKESLTVQGESHE